MRKMRMQSSSTKRTSIDSKHYSRGMYLHTKKKQNKERNKQNSKASNKTDCKKMQKNKIRFLFFLQNKNESGSGDVVSAPKRKTFLVAKKKCFWE